jgi:hypothetical protein
MLKRCYSKKSGKYPDYGGRGITVCDRWRESFENFLVDMGEAPAKMEIDRIDNDGDYRPGNCQWATEKDQARHRRSSRMITYNGKTQCLAGWAEELGMSSSLLTWRLKNQPVDVAFTTPVRR